MKKRLLFTSAAIAALCLTFLGGCGSKNEDTVQEEASHWENQQYDTFTGTEFVEISESSGMKLLLEPTSGTVRWLNTATGTYRDSNMSHVENFVANSSQKSDVVVRYFSGTKKNDKTFFSTSAYDSFSMSVSNGQIKYQKIDNGVRVVFEMGTTELSYKNFPAQISDERYNELVLQYLDTSKYDLATKKYYNQLADGNWVRMSNSSSPLQGLAAKQLYTIFYETGKYTEEDLIADLDEMGADPEEYPSNLMIYVPVDYYLEDGCLMVKVDTSLVESGKDNPINQLTLVPYFMTSDPAMEEEEGYMFVPDGSGALLYLDSKKQRELHFGARYYGGDPQLNATTYSDTDNDLMIPVFGMKTHDATLFGVIEEGAEVATLDAYISGTDSSETFSKLRLTFDIRSQFILSSGASNAGGAFSMGKAPSDVYDGDIIVRYFWLEEDADYVDMAKCYSKYLEERGVLTAEADEAEAPFYVELLGSTDKTKYFAGIPYEGTQVLTDFSQAKTILEELSGSGVRNMKVIYNGMFNGGMNQRSLNSGVKIVSGMGGKSGLKKLASYADSVGAQIFPNVKLQTVHTKEKVNNEMAAWNLVNERAQIYSFDPVQHQAVTGEEDAYPKYIVNPYYLEKYWKKVKKSYTSKTGLTTMASDDLYSFIGTNYRYDQASSSTGADLMETAAVSLAEGMTLMLSNPASPAYAYSSYLTDIPTDDSGMRVLDTSIPFMQLVLDGYKTYSSQSLNRESTDVYTHFMQAIEGKSIPKFTFMYEDSHLLEGTEQESFFAVDYSYWKDKIGAYYQEYSAFYNKVKDATIVGHEVYDRNETLRIVTYSNGVKIYFNYSDHEENIDGVTVSAFSYVIQ